MPRALVPTRPRREIYNLQILIERIEAGIEEVKTDVRTRLEALQDITKSVNDKHERILKALNRLLESKGLSPV